MPAVFRMLKDNSRSVVRRMISPYMNGLGRKMAKEARRRCPVDTGYLMRTIAYSYDAESGNLVVFASAYYAVYVEFGTYKMAAQPFLRPALAAAPRLWSSIATVSAEAGTREGFYFSALVAADTF